MRSTDAECWRNVSTECSRTADAEYLQHNLYICVMFGGPQLHNNRSDCHGSVCDDWVFLGDQ